MINFKNLKNFFPKFINKKNYLKNKKLLEIENDKKIFKENYEDYIYKIQDAIRDKKKFLLCILDTQVICYLIYR